MCRQRHNSVAEEVKIYQMGLPASWSHHTPEAPEYLFLSINCLCTAFVQQSRLDLQQSVNDGQISAISSKCFVTVKLPSLSAAASDHHNEPYQLSFVVICLVGSCWLFRRYLWNDFVQTARRSTGELCRCYTCEVFAS
jgi:hypothetical protein